MSYKDKDLSDEIHEEISKDTESNGIRLDADQIAFRVIHRHLPDFRKYDDFVTNAVWGHVRKMTGAEIRRWKVDVEKAKTAELPGFERLQEYYETESREGNAVRLHRVRREALNTAERRKIAASLRATGWAYVNHANELDRETDELIAAGILDPDEE